MPHGLRTGSALWLALQRAGDADELVKLLIDRVEHLLAIFYRVGDLNCFKDALSSLDDITSKVSLCASRP